MKSVQKQQNNCQEILISFQKQQNNCQRYVQVYEFSKPENNYCEAPIPRLLPAFYTSEFEREAKMCARRAAEEKFLIKPDGNFPLEELVFRKIVFMRQ